MEITTLLAAKIHFQSDFKTNFFGVDFFLINNISTRNFWGIIFIHLYDVFLIFSGRDFLKIHLAYLLKVCYTVNSVLCMLYDIICRVRKQNNQGEDIKLRITIYKKKSRQHRCHKIGIFNMF